MNFTNIKTKIKFLFKDGFFHIFGAGTINKIISLCSSLLVVRVLTKEDYGMYGYVINIVNIALLANGMGTITGMLQFGCMANNDKNKRNEIFSYGIKFGIVTNMILCILIVLYALIIPEKIENSKIYLIFASLIPLFNYCFEFIQTYLKVENKNKTYGIITTLNSVVLFVSLMAFSFFFNVFGALGSRYVTSIITIIVGIIVVKEFKFVKSNNSRFFSLTEKKQFLKFSLITCLDNTFSQLLYNIDVFVIGIVIGSTISIASYKAATTIPFALSFISSTIIVYIYPIFVKNKDNIDWIRSHYKKLVLALGAINGIIAILCFAFAPVIIGIVFGESYLDSVACFRVLIIGYWIVGTFRIPGGNVLSMLLHVKENMIIAISSGVLNIFFDIILIKNLGSIGAAIATLSIYIITAISLNLVLWHNLRRKKY